MLHLPEGTKPATPWCKNWEEIAQAVRLNPCLEYPEPRDIDKDHYPTLSRIGRKRRRCSPGPREPNKFQRFDDARTTAPYPTANMLDVEEGVLTEYSGGI
tara:strand:- start:690 stop:989 length:300 start_codon:yes stop_codon:yes gene_type:complete